MSLRVTGPLFLLLSLLFISATKISKHAVCVIINNTSADGKPVDVKISLTDKQATGTVIADQEVPAGIREFPDTKLKEGMYQLTITAHNKSVQLSQPVSLDVDRWVIINLIRGDSASLARSYGYVDTTRFKKINGQYAGVSMYVENRRPPNL